MRGGRAAELAAALILASGTWLGFATSGLPRVVGASAPGTAFSAQRAMHDLQVISATPHSLGSADHDRIRDYLVDRLRSVGADDVHVQSATGFNTLNGPLAATVANVVARKKGRAGGPAVLLSAHYDAVPRSFGAGDDGAGVAAILETVRALSSGPMLDRDLIVTFVDAEEEGLLGAEAFVDLHPWARDVGVVLNFDARGDRGPVWMFQTSAGNAPLIDALAAVPDARANSLTGEVYRHLPSDTDLSIWLHSALGVGAFNFANVDGYTHYHTPIDNLASLDPGVLQQTGEYALSLVRTLASGDPKAVRTTDAIYFNAPWLGVVRYPASWALIIAIDAFALVLLLLVVGWYRHTLTLLGLGRGAVAMVVSILLPPLVTLAAWRLIRAAHPGYGEILQGDPYNSLWYLLATGAFALAVAVAVQRRAAAHVSAMELALAPMLLWGIVGVLVAIKLPGASYLFAWPLFATTMCTSWWRRTQSRGQRPPAWLALFAVPTLVLWLPIVMALEIGLTASVLPFCALLAALMLSLLVLPLQLAGEARRWIVAGALAVSLGALITAEATAGFTALRRQPDSLSYVVDADSGTAWWISFDRAPDPWTAPALGPHPQRRSFGALGLTHGTGALLASPASPTIAPAMPVRVLADEPGLDGRRVHLHVARTGVGEMLSILADSGVRVHGMMINGRSLPDGSGDRYSPWYHPGSDGTVLRYFGVPEDGVDLRFTLGPGLTALRIVSATEGLPVARPRPPTMMSKPFVPTDMTVVSWTLKLDR